MIEIMIVIVVIGVLAALAFLSYRIQMLKIRNQEAIPILTALWEGQKEYYRENGTYSVDINDLDVTIPTSKHFFNPTLNTTSTKTCSGSPQLYRVKLLSRRDGYRLYVLENGRVVCDLGGCNSALCKKMGFTTDW